MTAKPNFAIDFNNRHALGEPIVQRRIAIDVNQVGLEPMIDEHLLCVIAQVTARARVESDLHRA